MSAADPFELVPELGVSFLEVHNLVTATASALGVNMRADGGVPTLETIYNHTLTELGAEMGLLADALVAKGGEAEEIAAHITRLHGRLDLICQQAPTLAKLLAVSLRKRGGGS